jgi:hypothetical protein
LILDENRAEDYLVQPVAMSQPFVDCLSAIVLRTNADVYPGQAPACTRAHSTTKLDPEAFT